MKTLKHIFLIVGLVMAWYGCKKDAVAPAPSKSLGGKVTNKRTALPIKDATVTLKPDGDQRTTNQEGSFTFSNKQPNNYVVEVDVQNFVPYKSDEIVLQSDDSKTLEIKLQEIVEYLPDSPLNFGVDKKVDKFEIRNNLKKDINFTIKINNPDWLSVQPLSGTIPPDGSLFPITITINRNGLPASSYPASLSIKFTNGVALGKQFNINFDVPNAEAPSVTSEKPTNITPTSAQILGNITSIGKGVVTRYGHVWGLTINPICCKPGFYTDFGSRGVGQFVSNVTGLKAGETYYIRAFAENEKGLNYSFNNEYNFTTPTTATEPSVSIGDVTVVSPTSAKIVGKVNNNGGSPIVEYGHVWSKTNTTPDPRTEKTKTTFTGEPTNGDYISNLTDILEPNTQYYVAAYAKNGSSSSYGISPAIKFNTPVPVTEPKLTTAAATDIDYTSATMKGSVTELGSVKIVEHGFVYSKSNANPTIGGKNCAFKNLGSLSINSQSPYSVSNKVTGMLKGMYYYYKTYIKTENGDYYYSNTVKNFATKEDNLNYYWVFNNSYNDMSSNGNHGEGSAKLTTDRFGNLNNSIDVSSGAVSEAQYSKVNIPGSLTISMWIKINESNFSGSRKVIYGHSDDECFIWRGFGLYFDPNRPGGTENVLFYIRNGNDYQLVVKNVYSKSELNNNFWNHIVIVKSGKVWKFYLNGELIASESLIDFPYIHPNNKFFVGLPWYKCSSDGFSNFNGLIDELRNYDKAFSDTEVLELYNREK